MKLSKSKLALAKVINENGGWVDGANFSSQDYDGWVYHFRTKPTIDIGSEVWNHGGCIGKGHFKVGKINNWHQCVLSREEYYLAYPKADADRWIEWNGGECPITSNELADIKWSDGFECVAAKPSSFRWSFIDGFSNIIAYRLHKPEVKPEPCESVMRSIPEPEATIEQLAADYRNAKDYADRKQDEADKASMESDAALSQLEDAIAAIGFVITPLAATEKEPELVAAVKVGDQVECVESNIKRDKYNGMVGRLHFIDESDTSTPYLVDFGGNEQIWCHKVKFIRRP